MKIAVSSSEGSLDAGVDPRFGRCACFAIVDADTMSVHAIPNPGAAMGQGAGIQAAQAVAAEGAQAVISGQMGPNAYQALSAAGIRMYAGSPVTVRQAVEQLKANTLPVITGATAPGHHGGAAPADAPVASSGAATAPGGGMGRRMRWRQGGGGGGGFGGGGGGRGFGGGRGRGRGAAE